MAKMMATEHGFYKGKYIKKGEIFDYPDKERPRRWMVKAPVTKDSVKRDDDKTGSPAGSQPPQTLSEIAKAQGDMGDVSQHTLV